MLNLKWIKQAFCALRLLIALSKMLHGLHMQSESHQHTREKRGVGMCQRDILLQRAPLN